MSYIYSFFGWILKLCYSISFNNYILTLLIFALVMQIILFPFGIKQQKSTVKRAALRPKEEEITRKYRGRNDRQTQQKMQMEIQEMYKAEGYSPTAGCLPLLIQFPIIIALFAVVRAPLTYTTDMNRQGVGESGYVLNDFYQQAYRVIDNQVGAYEDRVSALEASKEGKSEEEAKQIDADIKYAKDRISSLKATKLAEDKRSGLMVQSSAYRELDLIKFMQNDVNTFMDDFTDENGVFAVEGSDISVILPEKKGKDVLESGSFTDKLIAKEDASALYEGAKEYDFNRMLSDKGIYTEKDVEKGIKNGAMCLPNFEFIGSTTILDQPSYTKFNWLLLVPILVFVSSFLSGEITRKLTSPSVPDGQPNPMNGGMMRIGMPLISTLFAFSFPAAIGIYWTVRSVFSIGQQFLLTKMFPIPVFTESELKEAVKEVKQAKKRKKLVTIEVDEDDTSYDDIAISEERAEKIRRRRERLQRENEAKNGVEEKPEKTEKGIEKEALKDKDDGKDQQL